MADLLLEQEQLMFNEFNNKTALELAQILIERMQKEQLKIAFEIARFNQTVFYYAADGLAADKESWIRRKRNMVLRFGSSTFYQAEKNRGEEASFWQKYGLLPQDYTLTPGGFPIILKGHGLVGAFTVTGLKPEEDHRLAAETIEHFLYKERRGA